MLMLRRAIVVEASPCRDGAQQALLIELCETGAETARARGGARRSRAHAPAGGERRGALADTALVGVAEVGDEVIVNVQALELRLASGGFDIVHVNLTRGL